MTRDTEADAHHQDDQRLSCEHPRDSVSSGAKGHADPDFLRSCDIPEGTKGRGSCLLWTHAFGDEAIHIERDVRLDLLAEVLVGTPPPSPHGPYASSGPRMRPIAVASRLHCCVSATSCFRPAFVNS